MCSECDPVMPSRAEIMNWLEAYPIPSEQQAGVAGRIGRLVKQELLAAWGKEEHFDVQQIMLGFQRLMCILQGFQGALAPLVQMQHQVQNAKMRAAMGGPRIPPGLPPGAVQRLQNYNVLAKSG